MSALGLCLSEIIFGPIDEKAMLDEDFFRKASGISRLASGSACRSVYGGYALWGKVPSFMDSSDEYAVAVPDGIHEIFRNMNDAILIVSSKEKKVSSRTGHTQMDQHPYAAPRYDLAVKNITGLLDALKSGDLDKFMDITESEALNLHALMMTSQQPYLLCEPNTIQIIKEIWDFRTSKNIPVCFTLDAGPNIHLLYPADYEDEVKEWIDSEIKNYCENAYWIDDTIGNGPQKLI
jgi:diphosphomevalonate decarboxylase